MHYLIWRIYRFYTSFYSSHHQCTGDLPADSNLQTHNIFNNYMYLDKYLCSFIKVYLYTIADFLSSILQFTTWRIKHFCIKPTQTPTLNCKIEKKIRHVTHQFQIPLKIISGKIRSPLLFLQLLKANDFLYLKIYFVNRKIFLSFITGYMPSRVRVINFLTPSQLAQ